MKTGFTKLYFLILNLFRTTVNSELSAKKIQIKHEKAIEKKKIEENKPKKKLVSVNWNNMSESKAGGWGP